MKVRRQLIFFQEIAQSATKRKKIEGITLDQVLKLNEVRMTNFEANFYSSFTINWWRT